MRTSIFIFFIVALSACKKEIQVKLDSKESKIVIEADFAANQKKNYLRISKTGGVTQPNEFQPASGAVVTISDGHGYEETLGEEQSGHYHTASFAGVAGRTYYLTVRFENKTYEAQCTIQPPVKADTVLLVRGSYAGTAMDGFLPVYKDSPGMRNYYRFIEYLNGKRLPGSTIRTDEFTDAQVAKEAILNMDLHLQSGDKYEVEMQCIDEAVYKYFLSAQQTANLNSAAPANPVSNISNGALGYFSVCFPQKAMLMVNE